MFRKNVVPVILIQFIRLESECIWVNPINLYSRIAKVLDAIDLVLQVVEKLDLHNIFVFFAIVGTFLAWVESDVDGYNAAMLNNCLGQGSDADDANFVLFEADGANVLI